MLLANIPDKTLAELVRGSAYLQNCELVEEYPTDQQARYVLVFAVEAGGEFDRTENLPDAIESAMQFASGPDWFNRCWRIARLVDGKVEILDLTHQQACQLICKRCGVDLPAGQQTFCDHCAKPAREEGAVHVWA